MSAFLGPIHGWLFNKIKFQKQLIDVIIQLAKSKEWSFDLEERVNRRYEMLEDDSLENIVDTNNIHGWLQDRVSLVENKLAFVVTSLLEEDKDRLQSIKDEMESLGRENHFNQDITPGQAYKALDDLFLNGMPCDRVNEVIRESETEIVWKQITDIHENYWNSIEGRVEDFNELRSSIIKGLLSGTKLDFSEIEPFVYTIQRRD